MKAAEKRPHHYRTGTNFSPRSAVRPAKLPNFSLGFQDKLFTRMRSLSAPISFTESRFRTTQILGSGSICLSILRKQRLKKIRSSILFDIAPTVLESMEFSLPDSQMDLGVSLFSKRKTLLEAIGPDSLNQAPSQMRHSFEHQNLLIGQDFFAQLKFFCIQNHSKFERK